MAALISAQYNCGDGGLGSKAGAGGEGGGGEGMVVMIP